MNRHAITLIKNFEGLRLKPYQCPGGYWTIGWGHRLLKNEFFGSIYEEYAEKLLKEDLAKCLWVLGRLVTVPLSEGEEGALLSFIFNVGAAAFQRSTLRMKVNREEHEEVPEELARWVWAQGQRLPGLEVRRHQEGLCYQGIFPPGQKKKESRKNNRIEFLETPPVILTFL